MDQDRESSTGEERQPACERYRLEPLETPKNHSKAISWNTVLKVVKQLLGVLSIGKPWLQSEVDVKEATAEEKRAKAEKTRAEACEIRERTRGTALENTLKEIGIAALLNVLPEKPNEHQIKAILNSDNISERANELLRNYFQEAERFAAKGGKLVGEVIIEPDPADSPATDPPAEASPKPPAKPTPKKKRTSKRKK